MARKKSATKRAREAAAKEVGAADVKKSVQETVKPVDNKIDESDSGESSSSEEEDEFGELITEDVEEGINSVLQAIRNNDTESLLNPEVKFFDKVKDATVNSIKKKTDKPIYLKDYHRMNLLSGHVESDDEDDTEIGDKEPKTVDGKPSFVELQRDERKKLLSEINDAFDGGDDDEDDDEGGDDDEDDDGFLKKKEHKVSNDTPRNVLPDPIKNENKFLDEFMNTQSWLPKEGDRVINLDLNNEDDDEFDKAAENFENAYNFRYEDPNAAEIVSYARNQATLRRSKTTSRRKKRDDDKQEKVTEREMKETAVQKKKTKKVNKLTDVLEQLKKEFGSEIDEKMVKKITNTLLNSDYSENDWDNVVAELFNDEFYNSKEKPEWDDNLIHENIYDENDQDIEEHEEEEEEQLKEKQEKNSNKKDKKDKKKKEMKDKRKLNEMVDKAVEQNKLTIIEEVENEQNERGRSKNKEEEVKFRYREVSPESFGLSNREIFAADDADLNDFISLKKFAPYRGRELRHKDKRKVIKSRRLRDWRKKVFNDENGLQTKEGEEETDEISVPVNEGKNYKKRSHSHHNHHGKDKKHIHNKK